MGLAIDSFALGGSGAATTTAGTVGATGAVAGAAGIATALMPAAGLAAMFLGGGGTGGSMFEPPQDKSAHSSGALYEGAFMPVVFSGSSNSIMIIAFIVIAYLLLRK